MIGGILSCGLTHCNCPSGYCKMQKASRLHALKITWRRAEKDQQNRRNQRSYIGWAPALIGYSLQGFGKYGFYEIFKDVYKNIFGEQNAYKYQTVGFLVSSVWAEFIADILLCPFESLKIRTQVDLTGTFHGSDKFPIQWSSLFDLKELWDLYTETYWQKIQVSTQEQQS